MEITVHTYHVQHWFLNILKVKSKIGAANLKKTNIRKFVNHMIILLEILKDSKNQNIFLGGHGYVYSATKSISSPENMRTNLTAVYNPAPGFRKVDKICTVETIPHSNSRVRPILYRYRVGARVISGSNIQNA